LGDYNNLPPSDKKFDIAISELSNGNVYTEILSELQPPIKTFSDDVKLEALSLGYSAPGEPHVSILRATILQK
jgi:hypothetical protein